LKPSAQASAHVTPEHITACDPAGHAGEGLHWHVVQPVAGSTAMPFGQKIGGHAIAGHAVRHDGAFHAHLPSAFRLHAAGMILPLGQYGAA
jgi:hypothetical protein